MSQHLVSGHDGRYLVRIGWDTYGHTFFLQITTMRDEEEDNEPFIWLGRIAHQPISSLEPILEAVAPYASIPVELQMQLLREQADDSHHSSQSPQDPVLAEYTEYALISVAQEHFVARQYDEALAVLEKVLTHNSEALVAIVMKAGIAVEQGQQKVGEARQLLIQQGITFYQQAIDLAHVQGHEEIIPGLRIGIGRAQENMGFWDEALAQYEQALQANPREALAWEAKADVLLYRKGKPIEALFCYDTALELNSDNDGALRYNRALALREINERKEAEQ